MSNQIDPGAVGHVASCLPVPKTGNLEDGEYRDFLARFDARFSTLEGPLFTTDADVWTAYIESFEPSVRQFHNCNSCRHFLERFGALAVIGENGELTSALWCDGLSDRDHDSAIGAMTRAVAKSKVTGVFLVSEATLGNPVTGIWRHLSLSVPASRRFRHLLLTAGQAIASKREDFNTVTRALAEFRQTTLNQAVQILKSDALYRSEKVLGQAEWLRDLQAARDGQRGPRRENVVWRTIASAPDGFCHPRSSMIGTLLEDLEAGLPFDDVARKFAAKIHPLQYQRPQAAPSAGNIAQAEKLVEKLGIAPSLERRFARLDEIPETLWKPRKPGLEPSTATGGVFAHLKPKGAAQPSSVALPSQTITWEKFARTVLSDALSIDVHVPARGNFVAIVTAVNPDAPPIHQWDSLERRNPFSLYVYNGGSLASQWGLSSTTWQPVTAVTKRPSAWFGNTATHHGDGIALLIAGAKDSRTGQGNALFPESMRSELREIRSTIESYSRRAELSGREDASACGLMLAADSTVRVRVTTASGVLAEYVIDRLD